MEERDPRETGAGEQEEARAHTQAVTRADPIEFKCSNCAATMRWDPEADALGCEYCGHKEPVPRGEGTIVEHRLEDAGAAARGLGIEVRVTKCANCGARVTFDEKTTSDVCVYCGSASILAQEANRNALRPESLVPLEVGRAQVQENFERWIAGLWFRPGELKKTKDFQAAGLYAPFWTFDCDVHSNWSADSGTYYYVTQTVTVMVNGKPQRRQVQVRKVRWRPAWGERDDTYDEILIHASTGLQRRLIERLGAFNTQELVPYKPQYLAGWRAEEYQVDLEQGWEQAEQQVVSTQRHRCGADVPGDTYRHLKVKNRISEVHWKHVLLPVWSVQYRFRGKTFTVLVNGQSGQVTGDAPYSWFKILGLVLLVGLAILVAFLLGA